MSQFFHHVNNNLKLAENLSFSSSLRSGNIFFLYVQICDWRMPSEEVPGVVGRPNKKQSLAIESQQP